MTMGVCASDCLPVTTCANLAGNMTKLPRVEQLDPTHPTKTSMYTTQMFSSSFIHKRSFLLAGALLLAKPEN